LCPILDQPNQVQFPPQIDYFHVQKIVLNKIA
ncbi:unnamed protein product, partial [Rotaria sp. Silwood2]